MPQIDPRVAHIAAAHEAAIRAVEAVDHLRRIIGENGAMRDRNLIAGAEIAAMNYMAATQQLSRIVTP
jgi:hypothetical protein